MGNASWDERSRRQRPEHRGRIQRFHTGRGFRDRCVHQPNRNRGFNGPVDPFRGTARRGCLLVILRHSECALGHPATGVGYTLYGADVSRSRARPLS